MKKTQRSLSSATSLRITASRIGSSKRQLVLRAIICSVSYSLTSPEKIAVAMKNKIGQSRGLSFLGNLRCESHWEKAIKNNIKIEASVPAILNVLHVNNR